MTNCVKVKNMFVITLDDGHTSSYDFATGKYYGFSGKEVLRFNSKILSALRNSNDILGTYLYRKNLKDYCEKDWDIRTVETLYSIFGEMLTDYYDFIELNHFCNRDNIVLDKKNVKILKAILTNIKENHSEILYRNIRERYDNIIYSQYSEAVIKLLKSADSEMKEFILADADKITFRAEHEFWYNLVSYEPTVTGIVLDYIRICNILGKKRDYKNLFMSYSLMKEEMNLREQEICAKYQTEANLEYENDIFKIIVPTTTKEFFDEGERMSNCVFRLYFPKVKKCETHVVFVRRKDDIDNSYITCEVDNRGNIIQYLAKYNRFPTDSEAIAFRNEYQKYLSLNF